MSKYVKTVNHLLYCVSVPTAPVNLDGELLNTTAIALYWDPPKSANGILLQYQVIYYSLDEGTEVQLVKYNILLLYGALHCQTHWFLRNWVNQGVMTHTLSLFQVLHNCP